MSLQEGGTRKAAALSVCLLLLLCAVPGGASSSGISFSERPPVRVSEISVHGISYPLFSDNYKMFTWDSLMDEEPVVVGEWQGNSVEMIRGQKADYYHVLGTWLVAIDSRAGKSGSTSAQGEDEAKEVGQEHEQVQEEEESQQPPEHPALALEENESSTSVPSYHPKPNEGNVNTSLLDRRVLERRELVASLGSAPAAAQNSRLNELSFWAFYNGAWTQGPTAVRQYQQMNLVAKNSLSQPIWGFDSGSDPSWTYWGEIGPGFVPSTFYADSKGWHKVRIWGESTGFSNSLAVYVW